MSPFLLSLTTLVAGAFGAATAPQGTRWTARAGWMSCLAASLLGLVAAAQGFFARDEAQITGALGSDLFAWRIDALAVAFLAAIFLAAPAVAAFGAYDDLALRRRWLPFSALITGAALAVVAHGVFLLILAWELVALGGAWLAANDRTAAGGRKVVAAQVPVALLIITVTLWSARADTMVLSAQTLASPMTVLGAALTLVSTGWLVPDSARSAAHAFYRCLMRLMALAVLLRFVRLAGVLPAYVSVIVVIGGCVLAALAFRERVQWERLPAQAERQQAVVLLLGVGAALAGVARADAALALLAMAGVLMLALGQTFSTLLVAFGARAVQMRVPSSEGDEALGGLLRRMPDTAVTTGIGALSSAGLPPFAGFGGVALMICACGLALRTRATFAWVPVLAGVTILAVQMDFARRVGKVLRSVFLGEPRGQPAAVATDVGSAHRVPMHTLAVLTAVFGLLPVLAFVVVAPAAVQVTQAMMASRTNAVDAAFLALRWITAGVVITAVLGGAAAAAATRTRGLRQ